MGCHQKAIARHVARIKADPANTDFWLDQLYDSLTRATEWDADRWGLSPDLWMTKERAEMERRIKAGGL